MTEQQQDPERTRPAGDLRVWLGDITRALTSEGSSSVPCGDCSACCSASQFVHVAPDETDALRVIPADLLVDAPGLPSGHRLLGYDAQGRCPMLGPEGCTIYADRPRACRVYDCRVFAATGVTPGEPGRAAVAARAASWRFSVTTPQEKVLGDALKAAGAFVAALPSAENHSSTALALAALRVHDLFVGADGVVEPDPRDVLAVLNDPST